MAAKRECTSKDDRPDQDTAQREWGRDTPTMATMGGWEGGRTREARDAADVRTNAYFSLHIHPGNIKDYMDFLYSILTYCRLIICAFEHGEKVT